jgi:branched-chain amino acid transport system substrate-binding protein
VCSSDLKLAGLLVFLNDVHGLGLQVSQGLMLTESFYWDLNDATREWTKKFTAQHKQHPNMIHAGVYGAVTHYLKAIQAAGTDEGIKAVAKMKETPINDFYTKNGRVREDGRVIRDMYLFEVKAPSESKGPWDYYKTVRTIPAAEAFRPLEQGNCPFVKKS